jgi:hypothetical protein
VKISSWIKVSLMDEFDKQLSLETQSYKVKDLFPETKNSRVLRSSIASKIGTTFVPITRY